MRLSTILVITLFFFFQYSNAQNPSITGNLWLEDDWNSMFNGEGGPSGVKIYLKNFDTDEIIDSTLTAFNEFDFPSDPNDILPAGNYYLEVPASEFSSGSILNGAMSCYGEGQADDGVDNDDNGIDIQDMGVITSSFPLDNSHIDYIDFCFIFNCNEENALASTACDQIQEVDIFCDIQILATFCNLMPTTDSPGNQPVPLCPDGGGPHNISWFAFTAYGGNYTITVTPTGCTSPTGNDPGIQAGLYTDCTFTESVFCHPDCSTNPISIDSDLLTPGAVYYFFIDGCNGSICSYEVDIAGHPLPPNIQPEDLCQVENGSIMCEDVEYCPNDPVVLEVTGMDDDLTLDYHWKITTLSGGPYTEETNPVTEEKSITLSFTNQGVYEVCMDIIEHGCPGLTWSGNLCTTVTIDEDFCIPCEFDSAPPVIQAVSLSTAVITNNDEVQVYAADFIIFASDDCTSNDSLIYSFNPQGPEFDDFYNKNFRSAYKYLDCCNVINSPENIKIYVFDKKGNYAVDSVQLNTVKTNGQDCDGCENDTIPPNPETIGTLIWSFPSDTTCIEIWASDFVLSAEDNCTGPSNIKYSFSPVSPFDNPEASFMTFCCEDVENSPFTLPIYTWDKSGNYVVDSSEFQLQPGMGGLDCDELAEEISGAILSIDNSPIQGAIVSLMTANGTMIESVTTDENGKYSFFAIPDQKILNIEYETSDLPTISAMDLVAILWYLLGLEQFTIPEILASDINGDGEVRVND